MQTSLFGAARLSISPTQEKSRLLVGPISRPKVAKERIDTELTFEIKEALR